MMSGGGEGVGLPVWYLGEGSFWGLISGGKGYPTMWPIPWCTSCYLPLSLMWTNRCLLGLAAVIIRSKEYGMKKHLFSTLWIASWNMFLWQNWALWWSISSQYVNGQEHRGHQNNQFAVYLSITREMCTYNLSQPHVVQSLPATHSWSSYYPHHWGT